MYVAIVGGSLGGLFAAALLRYYGHEVQVFERSHSGLAGRGAGLVAQEDVFEVLRILGLDHLATTGVVADERIFLDLEGNVTGRAATPQMQISWDNLYSGLRTLVGEDRYNVGREVRGVGMEADTAWIEFDDGGREVADLVIGADGIGSVVRSAVIGSEQAAHYTGYVAWRGLIPETLLTEAAADTLLDRFAFYTNGPTQALGYVVPGPNGEVARGGRRYNWVWYRRAEDLKRILVDRSGKAHPYSIAPGQLPIEMRSILRADSESQLPPQFRDALWAEESPFVQAIFDYETPKMVRGRLALLGDSAFIARPHTAMGTAKAASDALFLAELLTSRDVDQSLVDYERLRLPAGQRIVNYGRRLGEFME